MSHLISIGNSKGVRIPKPFIEQAGLQGTELTFTVTDNGLLISPIKKVRSGWAEACKKIHETKEDKALLNFSNSFDDKGWEW